MARIDGARRDTPRNINARIFEPRRTSSRIRDFRTEYISAGYRRVVTLLRTIKSRQTGSFSGDRKTENSESVKNSNEESGKSKHHGQREFQVESNDGWKVRK